MKKKLRHIYSFLAALFFLLLAFGSAPGSIEIPCDDPKNVPSEPLESPKSQETTVRLRIVEKETNEPIPNVDIFGSMIQYYHFPGELCPDEGIMKIWTVDLGFERKTDSNGYAEITSQWLAADVKDRLIGQLNIDYWVNGEYDKYVPKKVNIKIDQDTPSASYTISLLKFDSL